MTVHTFPPDPDHPAVGRTLFVECANAGVHLTVELQRHLAAGTTDNADELCDKIITQFLGIINLATIEPARINIDDD